LARSFCSCFIKNAPRFARRSSGNIIELVQLLEWRAALSLLGVLAEQLRTKRLLHEQLVEGLFVRVHEFLAVVDNISRSGCED